MVRVSARTNIFAMQPFTSTRGKVVKMIKGEPNTEVILTIEAAQAKTTGMTNYA